LLRTDDPGWVSQVAVALRAAIWLRHVLAVASRAEDG
jgi:hypothetical protein